MRRSRCNWQSVGQVFSFQKRSADLGMVLGCCTLYSSIFYVEHGNLIYGMGFFAYNCCNYIW
jgi:hypothetical protein